MYLGIYIGGMPRETFYLLYEYANKNGANQPAHMHRLISAIGFRFAYSIATYTSYVQISSILPFQASVAYGTCLRVMWSQLWKTGFRVA